MLTSSLRDSNFGIFIFFANLPTNVNYYIAELRALGLAPDFIVCRSAVPVLASARDKISLFCNVPPENVLSVHDVPNIYHVPLVLLDQNFDQLLTKRLGLQELLHFGKHNKAEDDAETPDYMEASKGASVSINKEALRSWTEMANSAQDSSAPEAVIALVGKYTTQSDAYLSVTSALKHACSATHQRLKLVMVDACHLTLAEAQDACATMQQAIHSHTGTQHHEFPTAEELHKAAWDKLRSAQGIIVPGGFGVRGMEGKITAIRHARLNKIPFLGICLGMQAAVVEATRDLLQRPASNSREFYPSLSDEDAAVIFMPEGDRENMGGTMRLGARTTLLHPDSRVRALYWDKQSISERHRHRYEVNPTLVPMLEKAGLKFTGRDETGLRMEVVELPAEAHPYFVAVQFHPEFLSRPLKPSPLFFGLLDAIRDLNAGSSCDD